jgi:hypothetical protein
MVDLQSLQWNIHWISWWLPRVVVDFLRIHMIFLIEAASAWFAMI